MKRSSRMTIQQATKDYEQWLATHLDIVPGDLQLKHERMREGVFLFLRATYYRWAQLFPRLCPELARAPQVLAVGDLHVENFGTWRDADGRLVWGINDFDETWRLPFAHDLVRLATSAHLAIIGGHLTISRREACECLLAGYREGLEASGRPFVLAEHSKALRDLAMARLREPHAFWDKLCALPTCKAAVPPRAVKALSALLPQPDLPRRIVHRVAGLGSLGRQRFVALCDWRGGKIAREAKALAPSAVTWAFGGDGQTRVLYQTVLDQSVRSVDPWVKVRRRWIVRRLAPDCSRIELTDLPEAAEETRLLRAMGWETANIHLGSRSAHALLVDLAAREGDWLHQAAKTMLDAVEEDWESWRKHPTEVEVPEPADAGGVALAIVLPVGAGKAAASVAALVLPKGAKAGKGIKEPKPGKPAKAAKTPKAGKKAAKHKSGKPAKPVLAGPAAGAAGSDKSANAAGPGQSAKAAGSDKSAKAAGLGKSAKAAGPGKPAKASGSGKSAKTAGSGKSAKGAGAAKSAKAAAARTPAKSADPRKPPKPAPAGDAQPAVQDEAIRAAE
jgi:hypothetical protein